jgi:MFS family permease
MADQAAPATSANGTPPWSIVWALSITQIVSWGSIYYAIAVLMPSIERDLGWSRDSVVGAFSLSLLVAGAAALPAGMVIDRFGGSAVMTLGSIAAAILFWFLSQTQSLAGFYLIWAGLGLTMALVLYDPAFTVITASFGAQARKGITALTLAGGLASTVFWPLTQLLVAAVGWRDALLILGLFNLLICAPLHALCLPRSPDHRPVHQAQEAPARDRPPRRLRDIVGTRTFWLLAIAFTANMLAFSSLSVHLIPLLHEKGYSANAAVGLAALVGPMQVAGRIGEYTIGSRHSAARVAVVALALLPVALASLVFAHLGWVWVLLFVVCYGASNGIMTIARGAIPAEIYGRERYGAVNGALAAPVLASRAFGPLVASIIWSAAGGYDAVLWVLTGFGLLSIAAFYLALRSADSGAGGGSP